MRNVCSRLVAAVVVIGSLLTGHVSRAQVLPPSTPLDPTLNPNGTPARTAAEMLADTTERRDVVVTPADKRRKAAADSAKRTEHMFRAFGFKGIRLTRPGKAAMLALVLPGAGQIYNHSYWKLPLVYGGLGGVIYGEIFYQQGYREFADAYNMVTQQGVPLHSPSLGPRARLFNTADALNTGVVFYRGYRDIFYLYIGLVYGLQIVDALVDAHLKDFDVSDDLTLHWEPTLMAVPGQRTAFPTNPGLTFALRVK